MIKVGIHERRRGIKFSNRSKNITAKNSLRSLKQRAFTLIELPVVRKRGFTLIELLIVIAIIAILATIVIISVANAQQKSRDAKRQADLKVISKAIYIYYNDHTTMPINRTPGTSYSDVNADFLQELSDDGLIPSDPKDPLSPARRYWYYDYGKAGSPLGALVFAYLENYSGTEGVPPSCRPSSGSGACRNDIANNAYCMCNDY